MQTITNHTPGVGSDFAVATGAQGQITAWFIQVGYDNLTGSGSIFTSFDCYFCGPFGNDGASIDDAYAFNKGPPGAWTTVASAADTGSTLSLMTLTLMALGLVARRFQRAAG